jgi:hypothetical protein
LVQDLWLINEAVIPLHLLFPIPILYWLKHPQKPNITKDAFFCIPLHPDSQPLLAFEDPTNPSQQLTWTVLPQGFRDSPHLFRKALIGDLLNWHYPKATLLQYVDDLLLCRATEPLISRASESFLNLLASREYKVSKEKTQLSLPQVTYLGMIFKGQTCSLVISELTQSSVSPLPQTIKRLGAFLGFCKIQIPRYPALTRPFICSF